MCHLFLTKYALLCVTGYKHASNLDSKLVGKRVWSKLILFFFHFRTLFCNGADEADSVVADFERVTLACAR